MKRISVMVIQVLLVAAALASWGGTAGAYSTGPVPYRGSIPAKLLLVIPDRFESVSVVSGRLGDERRHPIGAEAVNLLRRGLADSFESVSVERVGTELDAREVVSSFGDGLSRTRGFDVVAIPYFEDVTPWSRNNKYGFEVSIRMDFHLLQRGITTKVIGRGESNIGRYADVRPDEAPMNALDAAVSGIMDKIYERRSAFLP